MTNKKTNFVEDNRRKEFRLDLPLSAVIEGTFVKGHRFSEKTMIENISSTGAYFELEALVTVGTKLILKVDLPSSLTEGKRLNLSLHGKVVRMEKTGKNGKKQGVALSFDEEFNNEKVQFITEDN
ncbi:MAG: PilZ domain-containing protein [Candidatus Aminicenantes bacterium]|nr:PilZ domain-containing protein [Candidatus Aminicenantes bacterium]